MRTNKYVYDENSNIVQIQNNIGIINHTYDAENRLLQKGTASFSYDDNGNLLKKTDGTEKTYYIYNAANRLIKAVKPITPNEKELGVAEYQYDALGRKLSRFMYEEHSGTAKKGGYSVYGYDGKGLDLSYKIDYDYNPNSAFTALFQREYLKVNGMAISQREIELPRYFDADETRFLFTDALGSVTSVKSVKGGDEKIRYDAWGGFLEKYERTGHIEEYSKRGVLLGYNGKPYDSFTELYNYGYRHLDTDSKQWLSQDPIRDGSNWHAYLGGVGDPVNYVDLWGLWTAHVGFNAAGGSTAAGSVGGGQVSGGVAMSYSENDGFELGTYGSAGMGTYIGTSGGLTLELGGSANDTIDAYEGLSLEAGGSGGQAVIFGYNVNKPLEKYNKISKEYSAIHTGAVGIGGGFAVEAHGFGNRTAVLKFVDTINTDNMVTLTMEQKLEIGTPWDNRKKFESAIQEYKDKQLSSKKKES